MLQVVSRKLPRLEKLGELHVQEKEGEKTPKTCDLPYISCVLQM